MGSKTAEKRAQADRFRDAARELGCDENGEAFERAFKKIVPPKRPKRDAAERPKKEKPGK